MIDGYYLTDFFVDSHRLQQFVYPMVGGKIAVICATKDEWDKRAGVLEHLTSEPQRYVIKINVAHHPHLMEDIHAFIKENVSTPWHVYCMLSNRDYHSYFITFADEQTFMAALIRLANHHPVHLYDYYLGKPNV